ncbi:MAG TPA: amidohydrolase family protein [Methylomirabilota bacterium]|nr:amidohydrolase family protein [Methylomirabilota bacterium]
MRIVDAQIHIWSADTPARPWPAGRAGHAHGPSLGADEVLRVMDGAGVARAVLVPPSWIGDDNSDSLAAARAHPDRFAVMGRFDPRAPDASARLARWREEPGMRGIRLTFHLPYWRAWLSDGSLDWFWAAAEEAGLPLMIFVPGQAGAVGPIAARHPRLKLILDHLARRGDLKDAAAFADLDEVLALAKYDNVAAKVSAMPCYSTESYPYRGLHGPLRRVYDAFGPRRMLWGTDYSRLPGPYADAVRLFTEALDFLSPTDREWIMGGATARWLEW